MFEAKNIFYKDLLSIDECERIKNALFNSFNHKDWTDGEDLNVTQNSMGSLNLPETVGHVDRILNIIQKDYDRKNWIIKFENSYTRLYKRNSVLKIHTDRSELDITLSINIAGLENWTLNVSNIMYETWRADYNWDVFADLSEHKKDFNAYITPRGCGVACYGRSYPHWRDPLVCKDDEYVIQLFYHFSYWKPAELA